MHNLIRTFPRILGCWRISGREGGSQWELKSRRFLSGKGGPDKDGDRSSSSSSSSKKGFRSLADQFGGGKSSLGDHVNGRSFEGPDRDGYEWSTSSSSRKELRSLADQFGSGISIGDHVNGQSHKDLENGLPAEEDWNRRKRGSLVNQGSTGELMNKQPDSELVVAFEGNELVPAELEMLSPAEAFKKGVSVLHRDVNKREAHDELIDQLREADELSHHISTGKSLNAFTSRAEQFELKWREQADDFSRKQRAPMSMEDVKAELNRHETLLLPPTENGFVIDSAIRPSPLDELSLSAAGPPPKLPPQISNRIYPDSPNTDWRYWYNAGPRVDGIHCPGCGIKFQTTNMTKLGYIEAGQLESMGNPKSQEVCPIYCKRCQIITDPQRETDLDREYLLHLDFEDSESRSDIDDERSKYVRPHPKIPSEVVNRMLYERLQAGRCVIVYVMDATDFEGSLVNLPKIAGDRNPIIVALSKCDMLPRGFSPDRVMDWVRDRLMQRGFNKIYDIHTVDCWSGRGLPEIMDQARLLAKKGGCNIYVVGSINSGKSVFINSLLQIGYKRSWKPERERMLQCAMGRVPHTTLSINPVNTGDGIIMYDTPGIHNPHSLTYHVSHRELRHVLMTHKLDTCGFRFEPGNSLLFGGLGRIDFLEGPAVLTSWFTSSGVKIHYRRTLHVEEFVAKNAGLLALFPPVAYDEDFENRFEWEEKIVEVMGTTWMVAAGDIVIAGLGWVAVTLKGKMIVRVRVPKGVLVTFRPSLLPYESVYGAGFYTGFVWRNFYKERKLGREKSWFAGHKPPGVHYVNVEEKRLLLARRFVQ